MESLRPGELMVCVGLADSKKEKTERIYILIFCENPPSLMLF
jgi:hypothetical protein